jgi:hypothetical protein
MIVLNFKKYLLSLIILYGFINNSFACGGYIAPFAERIANGDIGTVFLCKVLAVKLEKHPFSDDSNGVTSYYRSSYPKDTTLVEVITVYLGKIDTNIIEILEPSYYKIGGKYIIFRNENQGTYIYKVIEIENNNLDSSIEIQSVKRYINILKQKLTGMLYYKTQNGNVLCEVEFKKGVPVNTWKEYNRDGWLEITYNLNSKVKCTYYQSGVLQRKDSTCNKDYFRWAYSDEKESKLYYKREQIFLNDSNWKAKECNYFDELKELNWRLHNYYLPQLDELPDQACLHFNDGKIEGIEYQKVELYSNDSLIRRWIRSSENGRYIWILVIPK